MGSKQGDLAATLAPVVAGWIAVVLVAATVCAFALPGASAAVASTQRVLPAPTTVATTTTLATTTTTEPPTTTTEPPTTEPPTTEAPTTEPPTTQPPAPAVHGPLPPPGTFDGTPYVGLGSWVDVYDWSETYGGGAFDIPDVDRMASLGVQTMFIQVTRWDADTVILEPSRLTSLITRARADGMRVVAWYLPDLRDIDNDLTRLLAAAQLPVDGLAVDIESRSIDDVPTRNQQLLTLTHTLRADLPGQVLGGIVLPPVLLEDVNPNYWPDYPWTGMAPDFDVWLPMSYWTGRKSDWRNGYAYTGVNIDRVRADLGIPSAFVHTIGGIGDVATTDDVAGMVKAASERGAIGGSLYDYRTTTDELWPELESFRSG